MQNIEVIRLQRRGWITMHCTMKHKWDRDLWLWNELNSPWNHQRSVLKSQLSHESFFKAVATGSAWLIKHTSRPAAPPIQSAELVKEAPADGWEDLLLLACVSTCRSLHLWMRWFSEEPISCSRLWRHPRAQRSRLVLFVLLGTAADSPQHVFSLYKGSGHWGYGSPKGPKWAGFKFYQWFFFTLILFTCVS